jgi:hypothetical protein
MVVMDVYTRRVIGFGVEVANLDGMRVCRMFNRAIARQTLPRHLSSDHDPLFRFHRWLANLRVLEVGEIKTIPGTPRSHTFVERRIGTFRRELLDRTFFWDQGDLERKLEAPLTSDRTPRFISLAPTLQRPLSNPGRRLNGISPHTRSLDPSAASSRPPAPPASLRASHRSLDPGGSLFRRDLDQCSSAISTKCGADNREGRNFCTECGSPFATKCPRCSAAIEPEEKFCGDCGAGLLRDEGSAQPRSWHSESRLTAASTAGSAL